MKAEKDHIRQTKTAESKCIRTQTNISTAIETEIYDEKQRRGVQEGGNKDETVPTRERRSYTS